MQTFSQVVEKFLSRPNSPKTRASYQTSLNRFVRDVLDGDWGTDVKTLEADDLISYRESLAGLATGSIHTYMSPLRKLFRYMVLRRMTSFNLTDLELALDTARELDSGRDPRPLPKVPPETSVQAVIDAAKEEISQGGTERQTVRAIRDLAIVHALRVTGMRVGELVGMKMSDVDMELRAAVITGKGGKQRLVAFADPASWSAIQHWIIEHPASIDPETPLFIRMDNAIGENIEAMSTYSVRKLLARLASNAGVPYFKPHSLRHRVGARVVDQTGNIAAAQDILGHASIETTRIYARLEARRLRDIHNGVKL